MKGEEITLNAGEAHLANSLKKELSNVPPDISYPARTEMAASYFINSPLFITTTVHRAMLIVLQVMSYHIREHGTDRHESFKKEVNGCLSPNTLLLVKPPIGEFKFLCPTWNTLWQLKTAADSIH